jgi:hypothetical protein
LVKTKAEKILMSDKQTIKAALLEELEGMRTTDTDGKTYHAGHPDVIRDQVLDDVKTIKGIPNYFVEVWEDCTDKKRPWQYKSKRRLVRITDGKGELDKSTRC